MTSKESSQGPGARFLGKREAVECLNSWFSIDLERLSQLLSDQEDQEGEEDSETEG